MLVCGGAAVPWHAAAWFWAAIKTVGQVTVRSSSFKKFVAVGFKEKPQY